MKVPAPHKCFGTLIVIRHVDRHCKITTRRGSADRHRCCCVRSRQIPCHNQKGDFRSIAPLQGPPDRIEPIPKLLGDHPNPLLGFRADPLGGLRLVKDVGNRGLGYVGSTCDVLDGWSCSQGIHLPMK